MSRGPADKGGPRTTVVNPFAVLIRHVNGYRSILMVLQNSLESLHHPHNQAAGCVCFCYPDFLRTALGESDLLGVKTTEF
jgi:hypothetical protein